MAELLSGSDWQGRIFSDGWAKAHGGVHSSVEPATGAVLAEFGLAGTLARLERVRLRDVPLSPDRGVIADYLAPFEDPEVLSAELSAAVGVVEHGLFPGSMVADVLVGRGDDVEHRVVS